MNIIDTTAPKIDTLGWLQQRPPKRFTDLYGLREHLEERSEIANTGIVDNRAIQLVPREIRSIDDTNHLSVKIDQLETGLSHWSFGQLSSLAGLMPSELRKLPGPIVADAIHWGLNHIRKPEKVQVFNDAETLRSVTGPNYGRVHDHQLVEAVAAYLDTGRWVPAQDHMGFSITDRALHMFLIDADNPVEIGKRPDGRGPRVAYRGLRLSNSELGYSSIVVEGFMFDSYCTNGCIFGKSELASISIRHTASAPSRWMAEAAPVIEAYSAQDGSKMVEHVQRLQDQRVAADDEKAVDFLRRRAGLSISQSNQVLKLVESEEGHRARSAMDMVNGITALARSAPNAEARIDMERVAGKLWDKVAVAA